MANICKHLENQLKELNINITLFDKHFNDTENHLDAVELIAYDYSQGIDMTTVKLPKNKLVDFEYIMNKINKEATFKNFTENFKKLLKGTGFENGINCYPTSYGIGIFVLFSHRAQNIEIKNTIDNLLNSKGIEYKNEFSNAGWVFRYLISKKAENINKL